MVEQMVCKRNKAHCSPIRRRFLKTTVAALLLFSTQAFAQQASCSTRTITSVSIASNPSKQTKGFAAILAENKSAPSNALRSSIASTGPKLGLAAVAARNAYRKIPAETVRTSMDTPTHNRSKSMCHGMTRTTRVLLWSWTWQTRQTHKRDKHPINLGAFMSAILTADSRHCGASERLQ